MDNKLDPFNSRVLLDTKLGKVVIYDLKKLEEQGLGEISRLPFSIRVLLESLLRNSGGDFVSEEDVKALAGWKPGMKAEGDIAFIPSRVVLQDFTGVPSVVDLAAIRSAVKRLGGDPSSINPQIPADLVIDHSVQIDHFGTSDAVLHNERMEFKRNSERYSLLRWAQGSFDNFRVIPPRRGIVHQVNLEYLASVVTAREVGGEMVAFPDTLVGTDSHTTMINGIGVMGWGVGGIEAEAVLLGQPYYMPVPEVVGFRLTGKLGEGITATDLVLTVTKMLRERGVVGKFVEFHGPGIDNLSLPDRATVSNMSPEYGATMGFFPVDEETLSYMRLSGRDEDQIDLVRRYCKEQGLFYDRSEPDPVYSDLLELDMGDVVPTMAGPKKPQVTIELSKLSDSFQTSMEEVPGASTTPASGSDITNGSVVIAAITSCTNTSNPSVMIGAGLLARNAISRGLKVKPYVKTSFAPGSRVVTDYMAEAGLTPYLDALGFHLVGYGCTSCIGNSGPLRDDLVEQINGENLSVAAVLSGNRNFEGRVSPHTKLNYLSSPPLVVAFALAGTVDIDLTSQPLGNDPNGEPVYLSDIWPSNSEIRELIEKTITPMIYKEQYSEVLKGTELWNSLEVPEGSLYEWDPESTYIQEPPFFMDFPVDVPVMEDIRDARVLALLGDTITTDHISPAGAIPDGEPAGKFLNSKGIEKGDFNSFGSRRGNHNVMMRGTFANIRLRNLLAPGKEGGWTRYHPSGEEMFLYDASERYMADSTPLIVLAGTEYGTGSSRDWAAKGTNLLGVKAVIANSYERIHRSNLVGMGVLPLQFKEGDSSASLGLKGDETFDITGIPMISPKGEVSVKAVDGSGNITEFKVDVLLNSDVEIEYVRNGGILHKFLRGKLQN